MRQTDHTAIVLRNAPYRDNDRMLTLLSPTKGRMEALARGCRRPKSPLMSASELFALGDFDFYERSGRLTVTSATLIETFYPLRTDFDRLAVGTYLLNLCELSAQPGQGCQELFMLLLHTLSRLTFSDQAWKPLLAGFLLHFSVINGVKPRLNHCIACGRRLSDSEQVSFDVAEGGLCCHDCRAPGQTALAPAQAAWLRMALHSGSAAWVNTPDCYAPFTLLRHFVESRLERPVRSAAMLPKEE